MKHWGGGDRDLQLDVIWFTRQWACIEGFCNFWAGSTKKNEPVRTVGTVLRALTIYMIKVRRNSNTCKIKILKKIGMKGLKV